jgi:hypothetical protein
MAVLLVEWLRTDLGSMKRTLTRILLKIDINDLYGGQKFRGRIVGQMFLKNQTITLEIRLANFYFIIYAATLSSGPYYARNTSHNKVLPRSCQVYNKVIRKDF